MPVVLPDKPDAARLHQDTRRRDVYARYDLMPDEAAFVCYRKLEAVGDLSDTHHEYDKEWFEEFVSAPPTTVNRKTQPVLYRASEDGSELGLTDRHGIIVGYAGKFSGMRYMDRDGRLLKRDEADEQTETTGREFREYAMWEFRIKHVIYTDGPARLERLHETAEQGKAHAQEEMAQIITAAFKQATGQLGGGPQEPTHVSQMADGDVMKLLMGMNEDRRAALLQQVEMQKEDKGEPQARERPAPKRGPRSEE